MQYMTEETRIYLSDLFRDEMHNSYLYQYISSYLSVNGLDNLSLFFKYRAREEFRHSEMVREFCDEKDILLDFGKPIEGFYMELNSISDFCKLAYEAEILTNERWQRFYDMCYLDGNSRLLITLANTFMDEQNEETEWACALMDYYENQGEDKSAWQRFDNGFDPESYGVGIDGDDDDD